MLGAPAVAHPTVWFAPDNDTPDYLTLFTSPEAWAKARAEVRAFKFVPSQVTADSRASPNNYAQLVGVDAFRKLKAWNIDVAIESPAVKEWDCTAETALSVTRSYLDNVRKAGGVPRFVAMDEPLLSGTRRCGMSLTETALRTAQYAAKLRADKDPAEIGDIEPYPSVGLPELKLWIETLGSSGLSLAFFHLDIDVNDVDLNHRSDLVADLTSLQAFLKERQIPFGIIFWSGHNPEPSDFAYGTHATNLVSRVRSAIGQPDQAVFQSWVLRASLSCAQRADCTSAALHCGPDDPPFCGTHSIPLNLPDQNDDGFSHTRLILEALKILDQPR